ncbi:MAG: hypothetical protein KG028_00025 [Actinobacteria bacterium]|nr:hypothetical protein [Actinomycetota bacterium]
MANAAIDDPGREWRRRRRSLRPDRFGRHEGELAEVVARCTAAGIELRTVS